MDYTKKIIFRSDYWYNDGLKKAQIRDMSGAAASLKKSLKYDRGNAAARNLLGLVYYGVGETAEALVQWIISKNIMPKGNIAAYFIEAVQNSPEELAVINRAVKRYNKALLYCGQDNEDMAAIELKRAVAEHPSHLKAQQLLALVCMHTGQYKKARQSLKAAKKLDTANAATLLYIRELAGSHAARTAGEIERNEDFEEYGPAGENVIRQEDRTKKIFFQGRPAVKYIAAGAAAAAAVMWFLIFPAVSLKRAEKTNAQITEFSERFNAMEAQISAQSRALDEYRKAFPETAKSLYESGKALYEEENYAGAADALEKVVKMYEDYEGGEALLLLGMSYQKNGDNENALRFLDRVAKLFPGTENADLAKSAAEEILQ